MTFNLTLNEDHEMIALRRALLEGKFARDPDDNCIAASPFVAELCRKIFAHPMTIGPRSFPARRSPEVMEIARLRMAEEGAAPEWRRLSIEDRIKIVNDVLSPHTPDEEVIGELIAVADDSLPVIFLERDIAEGDTATVIQCAFDCVESTVSMVVTTSHRSRRVIFSSVKSFTQGPSELPADSEFELRCEQNGDRARFGVTLGRTWCSFFADRNFAIVDENAEP